MNIDEANRLLGKALELPHHDNLRGKTVEYVMETCNGVGADWMSKVRIPGDGTLLELANKVYSWAQPASVDHDVGYRIGGTRRDRARIDRHFLENCEHIAREMHGWWNPLRWWKLHQARQMYALLRLCGWAAFNHITDEDRLEDADLSSVQA